MLDWVTVVGNPTRPTAPLKVALFTVAPNQETGLGGTEVNGNGYARTTITFSGADSSGATSNVGDVTFPTASGGSWGTIVAVAIYDNAATPIMLFVGTLSSSRVIDDGGTFRIVSGAMTLSLD